MSAALTKGLGTACRVGTHCPGPHSGSLQALRTATCCAMKSSASMQAPGAGKRVVPTWCCTELSQALRDFQGICPVSCIPGEAAPSWSAERKAFWGTRFASFPPPWNPEGLWEKRSAFPLAIRMFLNYTTGLETYLFIYFYYNEGNLLREAES